MFTGIIKGTFPVVAVENKPGLKSFVVDLSYKTPPFPSLACRQAGGDQGGLPSYAESLNSGASIAINGVCLTVVSIDGNQVHFDAMEETLRLTTIGEIQMGDLVNVERSARTGDEIGGHLMSGHVSTMGEIVAIDESENNKSMTFKVDPIWMRFLFSKGFVGLDGASLTIVNAKKEEGE